MVCLSTSVVACSLSPSIAVAVTVFTLPVKDEAETASLIHCVVERGCGGREREREKMGGSSHISDCKESQVVYTVVRLR